MISQSLERISISFLIQGEIEGRMFLLIELNKNACLILRKEPGILIL